tara:strand:+ start:2718 stop:2942 length:225 start_codon:yes stop_codon:yes gene_type:complete
VEAEAELADVAVCKVAAQEAVATQLKQLTFSQDRIFKFAQQVVDVVVVTIRVLTDAQAGYVHKAAVERVLGLLA